MVQRIELTREGDAVGHPIDAVDPAAAAQLVRGIGGRQLQHERRGHAHLSLDDGRGVAAHPAAACKTAVAAAGSADVLHRRHAHAVSALHAALTGGAAVEAAAAFVCAEHLALLLARRAPHDRRAAHAPQHVERLRLYGGVRRDALRHELEDNVARLRDEEGGGRALGGVEPGVRHRRRDERHCSLLLEPDRLRQPVQRLHRLRKRKRGAVHVAEQADGLGQGALAQEQVEQHRHRRHVVAERLRVGAQRRVHVVLFACAAHRLGIAVLLKTATAVRPLGDATTTLLAAHRACGCSAVSGGRVQRTLTPSVKQAEFGRRLPQACRQKAPSSAEIPRSHRIFLGPDRTGTPRS